MKTLILTDEELLLTGVMLTYYAAVEMQDTNALASARLTVLKLGRDTYQHLFEKAAAANGEPLKFT